MEILKQRAMEPEHATGGDGLDWSSWDFTCGGSGSLFSRTQRACSGKSFYAWSDMNGQVLVQNPAPGVWRHSVGFFEFVDSTWDPSVGIFEGKGVAQRIAEQRLPNDGLETAQGLAGRVSRPFYPDVKYDPDLAPPLSAPPSPAAPPMKRWHDVAAVRGYAEPGVDPTPLAPPNPRPPDRFTRERKIRVAATGAVRVALDAIGETGDFVEALWDALDDKHKRHKTVRRPWPYRSEKPKVQDMLSDLWRAWPELDRAYFYRAVDNLVLNQIEDYAYGKLGQASGKAAAQIGRPVGFQTGPAL